MRCHSKLKINYYCCVHTHKKRDPDHKKRAFSSHFYFFPVMVDFSSFVALPKQTLEIVVRVVFDCDDTDYSSSCDSTQAVKK